MRPFRFTIRTLLLVVAIVSVAMGLKAHAVRRQRAAVAALAEMGITVHYDHQHEALPAQQLAVRGSVWEPMAFPNLPATSPHAPRWLRRLVGDDYFQTVTAATLGSGDLREIQAALPHLKQLPQLREIFLASPCCVAGFASYNESVELLQRELPAVKITWYTIPVVG